MSRKTATANTEKQPPRFLPLPELADAERERFESLIDRSPGLGPKGDCHEWRGPYTGEHYPAFSIRRKVYHAHRLALRQTLGEDFPDRMACHTCDHPACVRGDHLFPGTALDNHRDMMAKGRWKPGTRKAASANGERNRHNSNAPDATPTRNNHQSAPIGRDPNERG